MRLAAGVLFGFAARCTAALQIGGASTCSSRRLRLKAFARRPQTAEEWAAHRRASPKKEPTAQSRAADAEAARAQRWAAAVGASAAALDGFTPERRKAFLDEWEREQPPPPPPQATATKKPDVAAADVAWERRVQFDALREGSALNQQDVLGDALRRDGAG